MPQELTPRAQKAIKEMEAMGTPTNPQLEKLVNLTVNEIGTTAAKFHGGNASLAELQEAVAKFNQEHQTSVQVDATGEFIFPKA